MVILIATSNHIYTYLHPHGVATSQFEISQLRPLALSLHRSLASSLYSLNYYLTGQAETQVWLDYALECQYIDKKIHAVLNDKYDHIIAM